MPIPSLTLHYRVEIKLRVNWPVCILQSQDFYSFLDLERNISFSGILKVTVLTFPQLFAKVRTNCNLNSAHNFSRGVMLKKVVSTLLHEVALFT